MATLSAEEVRIGMQDAGISSADMCEVARQSIDYLDAIRKKYKGAKFPTDNWWKKQALDLVIGGLHAFRLQTGCDAVPAHEELNELL